MADFKVDLCAGKSREQLCEDYRRMTRAVGRRDQILKQIWSICHRPSKDHPKGGHAYTHFMADFDEIRALCFPIIEPYLDEPISQERADG